MKESHNGSPANHQRNLFLAEVTAAMHIITYQLLLLVKTYGFGVRLARGRAKILGGMIVSDQAHYCQDCSVRNNYYLKIMAECSATKMVSGTFSQARTWDFYNGCADQLRFKFMDLMVWKIYWVPRSVRTDETYSSSCEVFTRLIDWSTTGKPSALLLTVVPGVIFLQALQLTWDPGVKHKDWVQCYLQTPWDPGGAIQHRLGDKSNFMGEGLSVTLRLTRGPVWWGPVQRVEATLYKDKDGPLDGWLGRIGGFGRGKALA